MYTLRLKFEPGELAKVTKTLSDLGNVKTYDQAMGVGIAQGNRSLIERTPKRIGHLRKAWASGLKRLAALKYQIANDRLYARFVEEGTGLFGPKHTLIRPKQAKVLRWKANGEIIFARYTRGMKPVRMLERSLDEFGKRVMDSLRATLKKITEGR